MSIYESNFPTVTIKQNEYDEFEVPTPCDQFPDSIYFTDDVEDAIDTAIAHWGVEINLQIQKPINQ